MGVAASFVGTDRFEVLRALGAGGMGVVYEAFDRERKVKVALKTLRSMSPESLLNFKGEFRTFQDLQHPNLVNVGELHSDGSIWFFSMELVEGVNFLSWVRPRIRKRGADTPSAVAAPTVPQPISWAAHTISTGDSDSSEGWREPRISALQEPKLRNALRQLALGLIALHDAGKVHRDIKPSNVFVTHQGRVVILDFGLATDTARRSNTEVNVVGTVDYMAPEQAAARQVGPEADWYSVGVMLYEALTGELPLKGSTMEVLMKKQQLDAPHPRAVAADIPEDLDELCADLLRFNPSQRPDGRAVLKRLGEELTQSVSSSFSSVTHSHFIGRERELSVLREAFDRSRRGARAIAVYGESGVGKSALVRHFTELCKDRESQAVVLAGTCYERENVPYKAVDGVVDALSRYMSKLPLDEASALLPRRASLLAEVFPVLKRVEAVALAPRAQEPTPEPYELRTRLFAALRELFVRLADRRPVVLVVDDLQWADEDSLALLTELLREPDSPALLMVGTVRRPAEMSELPETLGWMDPLKLDRLTPPEARELATVLLRRARVTTGLKPQSIAQEAAGHPLFIDELIRHAASLGTPTHTTLQLEDALWERITHLDPAPRTILELTCLASGRLAQQTASQAASTHFAEFAKHVQLLRVAHLLRTTGMRGSDHVEPYHGRVRTAVLEHLDRDTMQAHHRRLALALETSGQPDPEALCVHWREVGDVEKAAHFARVAAEKASRALAFDRAARFYEICLEAARPDDAELKILRVRLADALANAGRGANAAAQYQLASTPAEGRPRTIEELDLERKAAEQYLRSGHIDAGLASMRNVLEALDMKMPATVGKAVASLLYNRARVRLRGYHWKERSESQLTRAELARIDLCNAISSGLAIVDPLRGADFQTRQVRLALDAGEPSRVVRALAIEAGYVGAQGGGTAARTDDLLLLTRQLSHKLGSAHGVALSALASGACSFFLGRWRDGVRYNAEAESLFRTQCTGVSWETDTVRFFGLWSSFYLGELQTLFDRVPELLREAEGRGDIYALTNLRSAFTPLIHIFRGEPDQARAEAEEAIAQWSKSGFHIQHYNALLGSVMAHLYAGRAKDAAKLIEARWKALDATKLLIVEQMWVRAIHLRGAVALAMRAADEAEKHARQLRKRKSPWAVALGLLLSAGARAVSSDAKGAAALLHEAISHLEVSDMPLYAAAAQRRLGELFRNDDEIASADETLRKAGILEPSHMCRVLAPGF